MLSVGSLCSGIGGLELGLERAGMRVAWQCERDDHCRAVLKRHWPGVPCYNDIADVDTRAPRVDVLAGGFPCQPVSDAGLQLAQADERWLWPEFARVVGDLRPRYVLVENVTGLLARGVGDVLGDLSALGYDAEWTVLSACSFGAPHSRERLFLVAYPASVGRSRWRGTGPRPPLLELEGRDPQPRWPGAAESVPVGVAYGLPRRMERLRAVGNAVVPQVAEYVGRRILEHEQQEGRLAA